MVVLQQAEQVLSGARSRRTADGNVHASDAVRCAYSQATGQGAAAMVGTHLAMSVPSIWYTDRPLSGPAAWDVSLHIEGAPSRPMGT